MTYGRPRRGKLVDVDNRPSDGTGVSRTLVRQVTALLDALPIAVLEVDDSGRRVTRVNERFCALVDRERRALLEDASPFPWLAAGQDEVLQALVEAADEHPSVRRRLVLRTAGGDDVVTIGAATALAGTGGRPTIVLVLEGLSGVERLLVPDLERARFLLELANERDRIARDLHDRVIQRLFAVGMELEVSAEMVTGGADVHDRLWKAVEDIDAAMTEIRRTIFTLHRPAVPGAQPFEMLQATAEAAGRLLGHDPELVVVGPLSEVSGDLVEEMTAVTRELLTNVVKHADSASSWVNVGVSDGWVTVTVEDDGVGPERYTSEGGGTGLRSLGERASLLGGTVAVAARQPSGTAVTWRVPLGGNDPDEAGRPGPERP